MATPSEKLSEQLEAIIMNRIENGRLVLPSMPEMAKKALEVLRSPDFNLRDVATHIEKDPLLAAQVLRICNSAAMATREPCKNIGQAVARLGAQKLKSVVNEASAHRLFDSKDPKIVGAARKVWEHSRAVAMLAQDVAVLAAVPDPEGAYLAGLLHDVGKPIIATMLLETESQMAQRNAKGWIDSQAWVEVIQKTHRRVGVAVASKWQLPEDVCRAIENCGDYDPLAQTSIGNAVRFANALAKQQGIYDGTVEAQENDALIMVGQSLLGVDETAVERLTKNLKTRTMERAA